MRHPDHTALEGRSVTLFWAHHEKFMLIDRRVGFMGGIDLCFGRWDTNYHPIADMHPQFPEAIVFNGQEYNDNRVQDFTDLDKPELDSVDRTKVPRMGWNDVSFQVTGPVCVSMERHFVERYEFLRIYKYLNRPKYIPLEIGVMNHKPIGNSRFDDHIKKLGDNLQKMKVNNPFSGDKRDDAGEIADYENSNINPDARMTYDVHQEEARQIYLPHPEAPESAKGNVSAQLVRSISDWSHGFLNEISIQNAYISLIRDARYSVYIENQFFIAGGKFSDKDRFHNQIGDAIADRVLQAARNNEKFRVIIVIPAIPGFPGDLKSDDAVGIRAIMNFQYLSIDRGQDSILERISAAGYNPADYIQFFHLRSYDRLLPSQSFGNTVVSEREREGRFSQTPNYMHELRLKYLKYDDESRELGARASVADCASQTTPSLVEEGWAYPDINEAMHFVTEQLYIHSKLLIIDDRIVVCGSANINDRSMAGNHDSEIAMVIEEPPEFDSVVNGQPTKVSKFATSLRRYQMRKHLGLVKLHDLRASVEAHVVAVENEEARPAGNHGPVPGEFTPNMQPLPVPNDYDFNTEEDKVVEDVLSDQMWNYLCQVSRQNEEIFEDVFNVYPTNKVRTWVEYEAYIGEITTPCHVTKKYAENPQAVRERLAGIRGHLVPMAHDFLINEPVLVKQGIQYNEFVSDLYA